ncbi:MAG: hypothetical protein Aurels2KO_12340 [Aureliella sp.]
MPRGFISAAMGLVAISVPAPAGLAQQRVVMPDRVLINNEVAFEGIVIVRVNLSDCLISMRLQRSQAPGVADSVQTELLRAGVVTRAEKLVAEIDDICKLTDQQKAKLTGASKIDANRAVRALKHWREEQKPGEAVDQRAVRRVAQTVGKLRKALRDCIYEPTSLVSKSFASVASKEQQRQLRDDYLNWFIKRVRDFDDAREKQLLELMLESDHPSFLGAARETYIENVLEKVGQEKLDAAFNEQDREAIRRAVGMLVKP